MPFLEDFVADRQLAPDAFGGVFNVPEPPAETDIGAGMTLDGARVREEQVVTDDRQPVPAGLIDLIFRGQGDIVGGPPRNELAAPARETPLSSLAVGGDEVEHDSPRIGYGRELTIQEEQEKKNREASQRGRDPEMSDNEFRQRQMLRKIAASGLRKTGASERDVTLQLGRRI